MATLHDYLYVYTHTHTHTHTHIYIYINVAHFFLEGEMFQTKVVQKIKTYILRSVTIFPKIAPFMR
jgi:hypothetical protein